MKKFLLAAPALLLGAALCFGRPSDGLHTLHIYTTNDIHGHYFDSLYVGGRLQGSLLSVSKFISERRAELGADRVILLDGGDFLQGDNAAYYYNYVATDRPHVYPLMAADIGYDAIAVGNHDIETGPAVFDRIDRELGRIPYLAANAIDPSGKPHFQEYTILRKDGFKVAVVGFTNPNMRAWLDEDKLAGIDFKDPTHGFAQGVVDRVVKKEKPDVVVVVIHSGTGAGDGSSYESQGRDLLYELKGVDVIVCAHDHRPYTEQYGSSCLVNSGSHCRNAGCVEVSLEVRGGKVVSKAVKASLERLDFKAVDEDLKAKYAGSFREVKAFSTREIGSLEMPLSTRPAYIGVNDCVGFVHRVCLEASGADVSVAAPLKFDAYVAPGKVIYNDLFSIYPFENQLFVVEMTGAEIVRYLEASYDSWIVSDRPGHVLRISQRADPRTGAQNWSFDARSYNFDSAAGIRYTVDVTKDYGSRVQVLGMADGSAFRPDGVYKVAMTSYRASGGGGLLRRAGIQPKVVGRLKEIRDFVGDCFAAHGTIGPEFTRCEAVLGSWKFVPEGVQATLEQDLKLVFPERGGRVGF